MDPSEEQRQRIEAFQRTHPHGLATLFFSDLAGSTRLKQQLGDLRALDSIRTHHAIFREVLARFPDGEEVSTAGDSFFLVFATPSDAVRFALLVQSRTRALPAEGGCTLRDRIGIHVGEVFIETEAHAGKAKDFSGIQVDTCARIMALGEGDQILLSRFAFDNARQAMHGDAIEGVGEIGWFNHGFFQIKGVEAPVEICEVGELGCARLEMPASGEKAQRVLTDAEPVPGWRPAAGQMVPNSRWLLDRLLGQGGFGEVWLARHQTLKDRRVFKFCFNAEKARSLKREVTLFRVLREHVGVKPGIVAVHDIFLDTPPYYIVMDYVEGPTLAGWAEAHAPLAAVPLEVRLEIVAQIADALQTAHDAGVIHRDVKPSNILIAGEEGAPRALLTDFGIGQFVGGGTPPGITPHGFTQTMMSAESLTGTQLYLAPEILAGQPATIRSDLYALGVVLYQCVVGALRRPLTSDWPGDIADPLLREDIRQCVARDPADRFAGGAQLAAHLRALPERRAAKEREEKLRAQAVRRRQRVRLATVAAAVLLVAAAALSVAFVRERRLRERVSAEERRAVAGEIAARTALENLRRQAPVLRQLAESEASFQHFDSALEKLDAAIALTPEYLPAYWRRAWLLLGMERYADAASALHVAQQREPREHAHDAMLPVLDALAAAPDAATRFTSERTAALFKHLTRVGASGELTALSKRLTLGAKQNETLVRRRLDEWLGKGVATVIVRLDGTLSVRNLPQTIDTLEPLRGLPIGQIHVRGTEVKSLEPLRGMPLTGISFGGQISDLGPLRGMALTEVFGNDLTPEPKRTDCLALTANLPILEDLSEIDETVEFYIAHKLMPASLGGDARHLAIAAWHRCDVLVTWNCRHIANPNKLEHLRHLHDLLGLHTPILATPYQLIEADK